VDRISGTARIVLAPGAMLDYETVHQYNFEIAAHDCETGKHAQRSVDFTYLLFSCAVENENAAVVVICCMLSAS